MPALDQSDRASDIDSLFVSVLLDRPLSEQRDRTMSFDKRLLFDKDLCEVHIPSPNTLLFSHVSQTVLLWKKKQNKTRKLFTEISRINFSFIFLTSVICHWTICYFSDWSPDILWFLTPWIFMSPGCNSSSDFTHMLKYKPHRQIESFLSLLMAWRWME